MVDCINYFIIWFGRAVSFSVSSKLAKIFERKSKYIWKVQVSAPETNAG